RRPHDGRAARRRRPDDRLRAPHGVRARRGCQPHLRRVRAPGGAGDLAGARPHPRGAARARVGRLGLPRPAHDRRPYPPPAREARARLEAARIPVHGPRRRLPLSRSGGVMATAAERGARRYTRLNSVRNRLLLLFFAITSAAVGFVYLYVVPQLRSSLTGEKLQRLESFALEDRHKLESAMRHGASQSRLRQLARELAQRSQSRVTILGLRGSATGPAAGSGSKTFVI